jgi:hypothetical protein
MEKEFVPYEQALALKELGFNEPCFGYYDGNHNLQFMYNGFPEKFTEKRMGVSDSKWVGWISAPLYQQAFRWFRDEYDLVCIMTFDDDVKGKWFGNLYGHYKTHGKYDFGYTELFKTHEEAELECLKRLIQTVKSK